MLWSDLGGFFSIRNWRRKKSRKATSSDHDATCNVSYRTAVALSKLLTPLHCYTLPQHPKVLKSNWNIPFIVMIINTYFLCTVGKWTFRISYFSFQSSYSFFSVKRGGGGSAYSTAAWFVVFLVMKIDNSLHILQGSFIKTEALRVILIKGRWTSVQSNGDSIFSNLCRWLWLWFNVLPLRLANIYWVRWRQLDNDKSELQISTGVARSKTRKYN